MLFLSDAVGILFSHFSRIIDELAAHYLLGTSFSADILLESLVFLVEGRLTQAFSHVCVLNMQWILSRVHFKVIVIDRYLGENRRVIHHFSRI